MNEQRGASAYRELAPHPALAPWIECYWTRRESASTARAQRVLPDGCVDFLFDRTAGSAWLIGAMSRPFEFVPTGPVDLVAVRFRPGAAHALVRDALDAWTDGRLALAELGVWARELGDEMSTMGASTAPLQHLEALLLRRFESARMDAIDRVLRHIEEDPAAFRVGSAAEQAGVTRQWLTRAIRARAGLGPKELARILRLRRALESLAPDRALAEVALDGGYADQAHFTREARRISGVTPSQLKASGLQP